jgi:hypothetical protein
MNNRVPRSWISLPKQVTTLRLLNANGRRRDLAFALVREKERAIRASVAFALTGSSCDPNTGKQHKRYSDCLANAYPFSPARLALLTRQFAQQQQHANLPGDIVERSSFYYLTLTTHTFVTLVLGQVGRLSYGKQSQQRILALVFVSARYRGNT